MRPPCSRLSPHVTSLCSAGMLNSSLPGSVTPRGCCCDRPSSGAPAGSPAPAYDDAAPANQRPPGQPMRTGRSIGSARSAREEEWIDSFRQVSPCLMRSPLLKGNLPTIEAADGPIHLVGGWGG
eukprot:6366356-Pyramimonas_sp.AAC.1